MTSNYPSQLSNNSFGKKYYRHGSAFDDLFYAMSVTQTVVFDDKSTDSEEGLGVVAEVNPLLEYLSEESEKSVSKPLRITGSSADHDIFFIIGDPDSRFMSCTLSLAEMYPNSQSTEITGDLWITMRALNLVKLLDSVQESGIWGMFQFAFGTFTDSCNVSESLVIKNQPHISSIRYILAKLQCDKVNENEQVHQGYLDMLSKVTLPVYSVQKKNSGYARIEQYGNEMSILDALYDILGNIIQVSNTNGMTPFGQKYLRMNENFTKLNINRIIFNGFSLGAGSAVIAAAMCRKYFQNIPRVPPFGVFQFAGTKTGTEQFQDYCRNNFEFMYNVVIKSDPVICIPTTSKILIHVSQRDTFFQCNVDETYESSDTRPATTDFEQLMSQPTCEPLSITNMALGQIAPNMQKKISFFEKDRFQSRHIYAQSFLALFFMYQIKLRRLIKGSPYALYINCQTFDSNVLNKYHICPSTCDLSADDNQPSHLVHCKEPKKNTKRRIEDNDETMSKRRR